MKRVFFIKMRGSDLVKLNLNGITKNYGTNLALDHFNLTLEPGIYALLGPNGSGKSTLMNIIALDCPIKCLLFIHSSMMLRIQFIQPIIVDDRLIYVLSACTL